MTIALYMDHHVRRVVTLGLRRRGTDVLSALEDGTTTVDDPILLDRATALGRALFSQDQDLLREAGIRQQQGIPFAGVIYAHQDVPIGKCVTDLEIIAKIMDPSDMADQVLHLPL